MRGNPASATAEGWALPGTAMRLAHKRLALALQTEPLCGSRHPAPAHLRPREVSCVVLELVLPSRGSASPAFGEPPTCGRDRLRGSEFPRSATIMGHGLLRRQEVLHLGDQAPDFVVFGTTRLYRKLSECTGQIIGRAMLHRCTRCEAGDAVSTKILRPGKFVRQGVPHTCTCRRRAHTCV